MQLRRYEQALTDDRPEAAAGGVQAAAHYQAPVPHSGATVLEDLRRSPERPPLPPKARRPAASPDDFVSNRMHAFTSHRAAPSTHRCRSLHAGLPLCLVTTIIVYEQF